MTGILMLATLFLVAGIVAVPIATRLGLGSVPGYLVAGMAISPLLTLLRVDVSAIQHFAEFGVVMMLFLVGLELEIDKLWAMRGRLIGLGGLQVVLTALAAGGAGVALGLPWTIALALGMVFALSSTAIVLQTLTEKGLLKCDGGEASFAVLLFQDIAVIPMLALMPLLARPGLMDPVATPSHEAAAATFSLVDGRPGWQVALITLAAVAAVVFIGNRLTRPLFRFVSTAHLRELFTATALALVLGIATLMSLVGLSPALGTFIAGVVLASSEYRHELESDIVPFRGLLLGLFFMTVGANIDFALLIDRAATVIGLTLGLMAIKAAVLLLLARLFGVRGTDRWLFALGLAQAGEFGFVLLSFTTASQIIPQSIADVALLVVALSMLLTPALFILYDRVIAPMAGGDQKREADQIDEASPIIIAGHGRFGGLVARMLRSIGEQPVVVDYSSRQLEMLKLFGIKAYFGDATRPDLLESAGIANAKLLVVAIDDAAQITEIVRYVAATYPNVHIVARAVDRTHVYDLYEAGAEDIIRETFDSAVRSGRSAYEALGFTRAEADALAARFVEADKTHLRRMAEAYRRGVAPEDNPEFVRLSRQQSALLEAEMLQGRADVDAKRAALPDDPPLVAEG
ncbi:potassium transporter [Paracoccus suum]|uniref:Potassium transporter n=1 Tax=Paracoccus suum TaxID=2259340 RepID=A0A344PKF1_9RHOB|nr:cation:proton antiporter [Paracoccus suum]AXC49856.1 potassium transporter [Paracoccus suum]